MIEDIQHELLQAAAPVAPADSDEISRMRLLAQSQGAACGARCMLPAFQMRRTYRMCSERAARCTDTRSKTTSMRLNDTAPQLWQRWHRRLCCAANALREYKHAAVGLQRECVRL
jgi:hypothetical protein